MPGTDFLRTFAKHFTNLTLSQRQDMERALAEVQNSKEITSLETSLSLLRRKVDQNLPIPQLTTKPTIRGAIIEWPALADQRINFYEINVSNQSNFSSFDTFTTFGITIELDGLTQTNFVRVRGVRRDGTTTPFSETIPIIPNLFDITAHTAEGFYISITGTDVQTVLGGANTSLAYTPINPNGNSMVWGFISMYSDPAVGMFGIDQIEATIVVKVIGEDGSNLGEGIEWRGTFGEFWESQSIGPFVLSHPELGQKLEVRLEVQDETSLADGSARAADRTEVFWAHINILELGI